MQVRLHNYLEFEVIKDDDCERIGGLEGDYYD